MDALVEGIYEAAVMPEYWPDVLGRIGRLVDGDAAALLAFGKDPPPRYLTTESYRDAFDDYIANGMQLPNVRPQRALERMPMAFAHDLEVCSSEELVHDPMYVRFLRPHGFGWVAGTTVAVPSGDLLVYDIARSSKQSPFTRAEMERLDPLRPHLARAALLSHRLRLKAASAATEALDILGLPAAVLERDRTVLVANASLTALAPRIRIGAFDRIYMQAKAPDILFGAALSTHDLRSVRSIPLAATETGAAMVAHVVPIRRTARDVFAPADMLLLITLVSAPTAPLTEVLTGLFDLTPAEAKVARGISVGRSLADLAASNGVSRETVRTQLKSLMMKTGTGRQAELAVLLSGLRPI
jgi:DNA-binding CsgD family transcriptional regulator